jgi:hypothetical protein
MTLEDLRKKVLFQNSLDVWIGICREKNIPWKEIENYSKFIRFLQEKNINLKPFPLCVSESDSSIEENKEKAKFAESLSEKRNPDYSTFTLKLNDSTLNIIRQFELPN